MSTYTITLLRTHSFTCEVEVEAEDPEAAKLAATNLSEEDYDCLEWEEDYFSEEVEDVWDTAAAREKRETVTRAHEKKKAEKKAAISAREKREAAFSASQGDLWLLEAAR